MLEYKLGIFVDSCILRMNFRIIIAVQVMHEKIEIFSILYTI